MRLDTTSDAYNFPADRTLFREEAEAITKNVMETDETGMGYEARRKALCVFIEPIIVIISRLRGSLLV